MTDSTQATNQRKIKQPAPGSTLLLKLNDFSTQFRKFILRYIKIGYNINIIRQTAYKVITPITVNKFASLFGCTPAGRASDPMTAPA